MLAYIYKHIVISLLCFCVSFSISAQDKDYAISIISDLTSPAFSGRGYQKNGVRKAATYIENQLKQSKIPYVLKQNLFMPVSYIKKIKHIQFDSIIAEVGKDVIIYPLSCSQKGNYAIEKITKDNFSDIALIDFSGKYVLFDTSLTEHPKFSKEIRTITRQNSIKCKGFILCKSKNLMQVQSNKTLSWVIMEADTKFLHSKQISIHLKSKHIPRYKSSNIIGILPGSSDSIIAFTAHYDHMGTLNNIHFPGANDNASGVAMVLDIARELASRKNKYTVVFLLFTGEEVGLIGSSYFADNPTIDLKKIKYLFNLDVIGSGENGITVVNGTEFPDIVSLLHKINEEEKLHLEIKSRGISNNSDHAPFYEKGIKAVFIYAMGKAGGYHHPSDKLENMSLARYNEIVKLLLNVVNY
ncbi:MAG: M20/M25/M40 family metallo-hydrolase [Bacteroidales bacterium]|nr:M20/M25/M40 family metallo-hydrolase [Bacteroidales bacterium]